MRLWRGVPTTGDPNDKLADEDNVIPLPKATVSERLEKARRLYTELMSLALEWDRIGLAYNSKREELMRARNHLIEDLKEDGIRAEFTTTPPAAELVGTVER